MKHLSRRSFLKVAGALALTAGCKAQAIPPTATAKPTVVTSVPTALSNPTPTASIKPTAVPTATASKAIAVDLASLPPGIEITPTSELYRQSYSTTPAVDKDSWRLVIDGLVEKPISLTLDEIKAMPAVEEVRTLECIGNPVGGALIGTVAWKGIYLQTLLKDVKVNPAAIRAKFEAADDYSTAVDLEWILQPNTLLIYEINGEPLTPDHGYPLRILMPGLYGQKNPKWLTHIEFIDTNYQGYWEKQGWSDVAEVMTNSIITEPLSLAQVPLGTVPVLGVAFAGNRKIVWMDVQIDNGDWLPAKLLQTDSNLIWTQWSFDWEAVAGKHTVSVRAMDETGFTQHEKGHSVIGDAFPAGTSNIHSIIVIVKSEG